MNIWPVINNHPHIFCDVFLDGFFHLGVLIVPAIGVSGVVLEVWEANPEGDYDHCVNRVRYSSWEPDGTFAEGDEYWGKELIL